MENTFNLSSGPLPPMFPEAREKAKIAADTDIPRFEDTMPVPRFEDTKPAPPAKSLPARFTPVRGDWGVLRNAFAGSPLAVIKDDRARAELDMALDVLDDREDQEKRIALAAYYSQMNRGEFAFALGNLDAFIERYHGKKIPAGAAYKEIGELLNGPRRASERGNAERAGAAWRRSRAEVAKFATGTAIGLLEAGVKTIFPESEDDRGDDVLRNIITLTADYLRKNSVSYYRDVSAANQAVYSDENWATESRGVGDWLKNFGFALLGESGQTMAQMALLCMTGGLSIPAMGYIYGQDKYYDLKENNPEMSYEQRRNNAGATAGLNALGFIPEMFIFKGMGRVGIKQGIMPALRYFAKASGIEFGTEATQEGLENVTDVLTGVYGDPKRMTFKEMLGYFVRGLPEAGLIAAFYGNAFAGPGYANLRRVDQWRVGVARSVEETKADLLAIENPSDADVAAIKKLDQGLDAGNLNDMAEAVTDRAITDRLKGEQAAEKEAEMTLDDFGEEGAREYATRHGELTHNPAETEAAVHEMMGRAFPEINYGIASDFNALPENIRNEALGRGYHPAATRGLWDPGNDQVWIVADKVRPSDAPALVMHEVVGHKGLRTLFGDRFNAMLDNVWNNYYAEIDKLAKDYLPEVSAARALEKAGGEAAAELTETQRRYLTEEYLAHLAETDIKPSWWSEFLRQIKMGLRRIMPNLRVTDAEIEAMLARSARAMRRTGKGGAAATTDSGARFAAALRREGAPNDAHLPGQLRDGRVPYQDGFMEENNLGGKNLYADYEFLRGKHPEYFPDTETARAVVEFVLDAPEAAGTVMDNPAFVRKDESTGKYYRIEIDRKIRGSANHIRSAHEITSEQYEKVKAGNQSDATNAESPVLQPSRNPVRQSDEAQTGGNARTVSDFLRYNTADSGNVKSDSTKDSASGGIRFSIRVNHGSGHKFLKFDMANIGGGEGHQAFGWGLYFADRKEVAQYYKDMLASTTITLGKEKYVYQPEWDNPWVNENSRYPLGDDSLLGSALNAFHWGDGDITKAMEHTSDPVKIRLMEQMTLEQNPGTLYTVDLDVELDNLLICDNSLAEQPAAVREALLNVAKSELEMADGRKTPIYKEMEGFSRDGNENFEAWFDALKGEDFYWKLKGVMSRTAAFAGGRSDKAASMYLNSFGIPGLRYLDEQGGGHDDGTYNYVIWDSEVIDIVAANGIELTPDDKASGDIRFSLGEYSEADRDNLVDIIRPFVKHEMDKSDAEYLKFYQERGYPVHTEAWAHNFAALALYRNKEHGEKIKAKKRKIWERERWKWILETNPVLADVLGKYGEGAQIIPTYKFRGQELSGTWIARPDSKGRYKSGTPSDEVANAVGVEEEQLLEMLNGLTKPKLFSQYKKNVTDSERHYDRMAREAWAAGAEQRLREKAAGMVEAGLEITDEYRAANPKMANEIAALFAMSGKKDDWEAINAAIMDGSGAEYARAYREASVKQWEKFRERFAKLNEAVLENRRDTLKLQRLAAEFGERYLEQPERGGFVRRIIALAEFSNSPSMKYPEGRRSHEFNALIEDMTSRAAKATAEDMIREMKFLLDRGRIRRNHKGIATSVLPEAQRDMNRIREIMRMNAVAVRASLAHNEQEAGRVDGQGNITDGEKLAELRHDSHLLSMFGALELRGPEDVRAAYDELRELFHSGKSAWREKLHQRKADLEDMREGIIRNITRGEKKIDEMAPDAKKFFKETLKNATLGSMMRLMAGEEIADFDNSLAGELFRRVEDAGEAQGTDHRRLQDDFDTALEEHAGAGNLLQRGKFLKDVSVRTPNSGVFIDRYSTETDRGLTLVGRRPARRVGIIGRIGDAMLEDIKKNGRIISDYIRIAKDWDSLKEIKARLKEHGVTLHSDYFEVFMEPHEKNPFRLYSYSADGKTVERRNLPSRVFAGLYSGENDIYEIGPVGLDFLTLQDGDWQAHLKQDYDAILGNKSDGGQYTRMTNEEYDNFRMELITAAHPKNMKVERYELPLSQGTALQALLTWEQEEFQSRMRWNGWSDESIAQLKAFIRPEVLKMGYWFREYIAKNRERLDRAAFERYGVHLPDNPFYFPTRFQTGKKAQLDAGLMRGAGAMSINPGFMIERKFHLAELDMEADAFTAFTGNQLEQAHFLAWGGIMRDLQGVFADRKVRSAVRQTYGSALLEQFDDRLQALAAGGGKFSEHARILNQMFRYWVPAKIIGNISSILKQGAGVVAYMHHMPVAHFLRHITGANFGNREFREFVRWAVETDYLKNRMAGGLDKELTYLLNHTRDSAAYNPWADAALRGGVWASLRADRWSALHGGYAIYKYNQKKALKKGMSKADAHDYAARMWRRATDETQQSGHLKDLNFYQMNQGAWRYFTSFMSNPIQTMNLEWQALNEVRFAKKEHRGKARAKLARRALANHLLQGIIMLGITDAIRHGADIFDEAEWEDYLVATILGSFNSIFLIGAALEQMLNVAGDLLMDRPVGFQKTVSAVPLLDETIRSASFWGDLLGEEPLTEKEVLKGFQSIGNIGMVAGAVIPGAGVIGSLLNAIGTQGKRWRRLLGFDKD